jgi:hypothetical protein
VELEGQFILGWHLAVRDLTVGQFEAESSVDYESNPLSPDLVVTPAPAFGASGFHFIPPIETNKGESRALNARLARGGLRHTSVNSLFEDAKIGEFTASEVQRSQDAEACTEDTGTYGPTGL